MSNGVRDLGRSGRRDLRLWGRGNWWSKTKHMGQYLLGEGEQLKEMTILESRASS